MNSINRHNKYFSFVLWMLYTSLIHAVPSFILSDTKRNVWQAVVGIDLPDNHVKVPLLVNALIGGNLFFLELYFEVPNYQKAYNSVI